MAKKPWSHMSTREKSRDWRVVVLENAPESLARGASTRSPSPASSPRKPVELENRESTQYLFMCANCSEAYQREQEVFKKERQYYAQAKGVLYPKQRLRTALRRIQTNESWDNTASFHATYRPSSVLEGLGEVSDVAGNGADDVDRMLGEEDVTLVEEDTIEYEEEDEQRENQGRCPSPTPSHE